MTDLLFQSDSYSEGLAKYLVDRYSVQAAVVSAMRIKLHALGTSDRADVCALELGDVISLTWTPTGSLGIVSQVLAVEGIRYTASDRLEAEIELQLSDARDPDYFQIDTDSIDGDKLMAP